MSSEEMEIVWTSAYLPKNVEKERSWKKFFSESVQSDGEWGKEKYFPGTLFHTRYMTYLNLIG